MTDAGPWQLDGRGIAAHMRLGAALPCRVHIMPDDDRPPVADDWPSDVAAPVSWARPGRIESRPAGVPSIGAHCVIVGGHRAGERCIVGPMVRRNRPGKVTVETLFRDGRQREVTAAFVAPVGTPVPEKPVRRRVQQLPQEMV